MASPGHAPDRTAFPVATATAGRVVRDVTAAPANRGSPRRCCWGGIERGAGSRARGHVRPAGGAPPRPLARAIPRSAPGAFPALAPPPPPSSRSHWPPPARCSPIGRHRLRPLRTCGRQRAPLPPPGGGHVTAGGALGSRGGGATRCHPNVTPCCPSRPRVTPRCHPPVSLHCHPTVTHRVLLSPGCHTVSPLLSPGVTQCHPTMSWCHLTSPGVPSPGPVSPHCHSVPSQGHLMSLNVTPPCPGVTLMSPTVTPPVTLSCPRVT